MGTGKGIVLTVINAGERNRKKIEKISTHLLTLLIISVILQIEQRERDRDRDRDRDEQIPEVQKQHFSCIFYCRKC